MSADAIETFATSPQPAAYNLLRWFLVFTKPSGESTATRNLERQGYRVYYPRLSRPSLRRGRWIERVVSLLPRYIFIQLDAARQSLAPVRSTLGVSNIVRFGVESTVVPDAIVDELLRHADPGSGLHKLSSSKSFTQGAPVNIVAGAFEGMSGIFERDAAEERVVILLKILGQETPVCVPPEYVVSADSR